MPTPDPATVNGQGAQWCVLMVSAGGPIVFADPNGNPPHDAMNLGGEPPPAALMPLLQAQQLQAALGVPWIVNHGVTLVPPDQHRAWLNRAGLRWAL